MQGFVDEGSWFLGSLLGAFVRFTRCDTVAYAILMTVRWVIVKVLWSFPIRVSPRGWALGFEPLRIVLWG